MSQPERTILVSETEGPFLAAALFCEKVLQERDGVNTLVRIVDRLITQAIGVDAPERMPPFQASLTLFISLKAGFARGSYSVNIRVTNPLGRTNDLATLPVLLEGEDRGAALVGVMQLQLEEPGLYWFDVLFERRLLTRIPLRVVYQRLSVGGSPPGGSR
jgi:Family of unknown function (DUF6941)